MKHLLKLTFLLLAIFLPATAVANPITLQQAQQNAMSFLQRNGKSISSSSLRQARLRSTSTTADSYYIFNIGSHEGYVIAAGDDCAPAILGYADAGYIDVDSMPVNLQSWLEEYAQQIQFMQENGFASLKAPELTSSYAVIPPLMTTTWGQDDPYNQNCPDFFSYGKSVTGCVATAMAQVMYYHRANSVPQTTAQIPAYNCRTLWLNGSDTLGHIHVDAIPAGSPIDWSNMLDSYSGSATTTQKQAVANLMKYCGASVRMNYANAWSGGSGAYSSDVPIALKSFFDYSDQTTLESRSDYPSDDAWESLVYSELRSSHPVYYSGRNSSGGHAFVCDGYDGAGYYHINWGWTSTSDGYFLLTALNPNAQGTGGTSSGYNQNQAVVINAVPKSISPSNPVLAVYVSLDKTSAKLNPGGTLKLTQTVLPRNTTNNTVTWTSSNSSVATVSSDGVVTAKAVGNATITARTSDGSNLSASCYITVSNTFICFADANVEALCVQNWDTNGDGELSEAEAAAVTDLGSVFKNQSSITSFDELQYFTGLTVIGSYAFSNCRGLTSIKIPTSVTTIGQDAFYHCSGLTSIVIPSSVTSIHSWSLGNSFIGCTSLSSIIIDPNNTVYDSRGNCNAIIKKSNNALIVGCKNTVIPSSVTTIGEGSFYSCSSLTSIIIPNSVTSIGEYAFSWCSGLTSITIPSSVTGIGHSAFSHCSGLTSITVNSSNTVYDSRGNCNAVIKKSNNELIVGCKNTIIPSSVTSIGSCAFNGCSGLTSISIPSSVTSIGDWVFASCTGLTSITIPESVTSIDDYAFYKCSNLTGLTSLASIPPTIGGSHTFSSITNKATLYVPAGKKNIYENADYWQDFSSIVELDPDPILATSISLNMISAELNTGGTLQLTATVLPSNATNKTVTWTTSNSSVATVSSNGLVSAITQGTATITATTTDGSNLSASCTITVNQSPILVTSISLNKTSAAIITGRTLQLTATVLPSIATNKTVTWTSSNSSVATVDDNGLVTAVGSGTATITARTADGSNLSASCSLTVKQSPVLATSITLDKSSAVIIEGSTLKLTATVLPANVTNGRVTWKSSNTSVASVNYNGLVTAKSHGSALITASTKDGSNLSASCVVTVVSGSDFTFHIDDIEEFAGSTVTIPIELENNYNVGAFMFDFCYPEGFRVKGYTKTERFTAETTVNGLNHADENYYRFIALNVSTNEVLNIGSGSIINLMLQIPDDVSGDYEISLKGVQIVPKDCKTVLSLDDISANLTVKEKENVLATSLQMNQSDVMLYKGESLQLTATILPDDATNKALNWASSDDSIVSVDENGLVTAIAVGETTVIATTTDGSNLSTSCVVTVTENLSDFDNYLSMSNVEAFHGDTIVIPVKMTNEASIISFQTDIFLPDGLELLQEDGEYIIDPSERMTRTHSIVSNDVANGAVRVMCYSSNYKPFTGNSGDDLFYITVKVADNANGDYTIQLKNTLLTTSDFVELAAPDAAANVHVKSYLLGDANNSGTVTVTDVVVTSQYVLEMNPQPFVFEAADVNNDGNITVTDVSRIAWMVLNPTLNAPLRAPALWNNGDRMSAKGITLASGETRRVSIALDNALDYSAFQFDLSLPEGLTASNFQLTDRASNHAFNVNMLQDGNIRALCYSPALIGINGHEGALLTFDVTATGDVTGDILVDGIELVTTTCQTVKLEAFNIAVNAPSSVNEVANGKTIASVNYFNLAGQQLSEPRTGVNLVVTTYTDGTRTITKLIQK